ncbi:MAG: zf-HC2 domain-containing protein [Pyrinomonadaceae bacterium]|nr:zf-HC2 domain-containing protein [Pyrinomonadaceae bacterium]
MICKDFRDVADSYLSDELLTETNHDMIRHMENCGDCRALIGARREIRSRLKTAVTSSPDYKLSEGFDHMLMTRLWFESEQEKPSTAGAWFGLKTLGVAASLLVVAMFGFALFTSFNQSSNAPYLVSGFAENSLVNIAAGDHQHCAIEHELAERPVSLEKGDPRYAGLDNLVRDRLKATLADHKLVEAHACKYKDVQFAHMVMEGPSDTLSVLVAPNDYIDAAVNERISEYSSELYKISSFDVPKNTVYVISELERDRNKKAAEALSGPLKKHFDLNTKTAMAVSYGTAF